VVLPALYSLAYRAAERRTPVGPGLTPQPYPQDPAVT